MNSTFWIAVLEIIWVNVLLSGDNAVVIALAARQLAPQRQRIAIVGGSFAAIALRVALTLFAVALLHLPWLKLAGSVLLLIVGVQLLRDDDRTSALAPAGPSVWSAIRTILLADLVMSLDNVLAVAAAAASAPQALQTPLLVIGLGLSIPLIVFGSTLLIRLMERVPLLVTLGAALLGWVAGTMAAGDVGLLDWLELHAPALRGFAALEVSAGAFGAAIVLLVGTGWARRRGP